MYFSRERILYLISANTNEYSYYLGQLSLVLGTVWQQRLLAEESKLKHISQFSLFKYIQACLFTSCPTNDLTSVSPYITIQRNTISH
ncbi:unnamed protein product [Rotaria socialis]